jgi:hypothetical protein
MSQVNGNELTLDNAEFFPCQRKLRQLMAVQINNSEGFYAKNKEGITQTGESGDYLIIDASGNRRVVAASEFRRGFIETNREPSQRFTYKSDLIPKHYETNRVLEVYAVQMSTMDIDEYEELSDTPITEQERIALSEMPESLVLVVRDKKDNSIKTAAWFTDEYNGTFQDVKDRFEKYFAAKIATQE